MGKAKRAGTPGEKIKRRKPQHPELRRFSTAEKCLPALIVLLGPWPQATQIPGNGSFGHFEAELSQFPLYPSARVQEPVLQWWWHP
jgi:hypothetical protein